MKRVVVVAFALLLFGAIAGPAWATDPATGYIEVCKAPNVALNGTFGFTVVAGGESLELLGGLAQGTCSRPIEVPAGSVTVTETGSSLGMANNGTTVESKEFLATPTSTAVGKNDPPGANPATGWDRTVTVPAGGVSDVVKVTFANTLVTGVIEVCKKVTDPSLTGSWSFHILGGNGFDSTTSTTVGNCSPAITLPAGHFKVVETGNNLGNVEAVTEITATKTAALTNAATKVDLPSATVVATVDVGDSSKQTIVSYKNNLVTFKLCKVWDSQTTSPVTSYPFTFSAVGPAGPNTPPAPVSVAPGTCRDLGSYRAGTRMTVTEGITPGTKVSSIAANQGIVPNTLSRPNRTVTVDLMAGETVVTYTDVPALDGLLKVCKATTLDSPVIPLGTVFTFTLTAVTGYPAETTATVTVAAGAPGTTQCSAPVSSKFDATWTVTEAARPNTVVTAIGAVPAKVVVIDGGIAVDTNQDVLTALNLAARSANVTIGENNTTELTFTNRDPLPVPPVVVTSGGSSTPVVITPVAGLPVLTPVAPAAAFVPPVVSASKSASANAAVQVSQLKKQLATLKTTQAKLQKAFLAAKTKAAKNALSKRIAVVKASQKRINLQLKLLS